MSKIQKTCPICGKVYEAYPYEKLYCSGKCYYLSRKGRSWGGAISKKGRKIGKYNSTRVELMAIGKKEAHLKRALEHPEILKLDEARQLLKEGYVTNLSSLRRALRYPSLKEVGISYIADAYYVLIQKEHLTFCKKDIPCCIAGLSLFQLRWFKHLLEIATDWDNFTVLFLKDYEKFGVHKSLGFYKTILKFVQETNFNTKALRKDLSKNVKGYSTERIVRNYLEEFNYNFIQHLYLKDLEKDCFWVPDFVIENKLILEINGDYWHGYNKKIEEIKEGRIKNRVLKDLQKYDFYEKNNYCYLIIWEHELLNKSTIIQKIKDKLKDADNYSKIN